MGHDGDDASLLVPPDNVFKRRFTLIHAILETQLTARSALGSVHRLSCRLIL